MALIGKIRNQDKFLAETLLFFKLSHFLLVKYYNILVSTDEN